MIFLFNCTPSPVDEQNYRKVKLSLCKPWRYMLGTRIALIILNLDTRRSIGQIHIPSALFLRTARGTHWIRGRVGPKAPNFPYKSITFLHSKLFKHSKSTSK